MAECNKALTAVGPSIAWGNHTWKIMWTVLKQPPNTKQNITLILSVTKLIQYTFENIVIPENTKNTKPIDNTKSPTLPKLIACTPERTE